MKKKSLLARKVACTLTVGTMFLASPAFAAEEPIFQLDQITVTATRTPQTVAGTPGDVTVITAQQIEEKGAKTLADALQGAPGVRIVSNGGRGELSTVKIFGSDRVVVLVDGKRVNTPQSTLDINTIVISENVERVEVVRGGASALYGADAVGGVINIITKKGIKDGKSTLDIGSGNYGTQRYAFSNQGAENGYHWFITGLKDTTDGQRINSAYDGKNVTFRLDRDINARNNITFTWDYYGSHAGMPGSLAYPSDPRDYGEILRHNWSVSYNNERTNGDSVLRYYNNTQSYSGENFGDWGSTFYHENKVNAFDYQNNIKLSANNTLTLGGEYRNEKVWSTIEAAAWKERKVKALYVQDKLSLSEAMTMTTGLRYDNNSQYGVNWLPKVDLSYNAGSGTVYFANWGKVFNSPTFDDLYAPVDWGGNPDLRPERGWNAQLGVKTRFAEDGEATLALFKREIKDAIHHDYNPLTFEATTKNIGQLKANGINAAISKRLSPSVSANMGYTYLDSKDQDGKGLGDPRNTYSLAVTIADGKFKQFIQRSFVGQSGTDDKIVPGYAIWNISTNYSLEKDTSLYLNVNNLFNKKYEAIKYYPAQERSIFFGIKQTL